MLWNQNEKGDNVMSVRIRDDRVFYRNLRKEYPVIDRGEGVYLYDVNGKKYLDACGGALVVNIGHAVEEVIDAMMKQARRVSFAYTAIFDSEAQIQLAEKVSSLSPMESGKVFFVSGGSEANETAMKIARQYHVESGNSSKYKVISRWQSYHGNTMGALSMTGRRESRDIFTPYLLDVPHIFPPYCYRCPFGKTYPQCDIECATQLERLIKQEGSDYISAFIAEPITGLTAAGVTPPPEYYGIIRAICDKYNVLMIMDEVVTGFGRTGKNFGIDHWKVVPDIITTGKGMSSGYTPLGGVIVDKKIVDTIARGSGVLKSTFTYSGNPLSCAIGFAVLDYIEKHDLIKKSAEKGSYLLAECSKLNKFKTVGRIDGKGLLLGIEFVENKETKKPFDKEKHVSETIVRKAFDKGVVIRPGVGGMVDGISGDHILITPPFIIEKKQMDEIVSTLEEVIADTEKSLRH
jgi:adenosylmethionine-8-amino-7-oxononanoate aminotransferase